MDTTRDVVLLKADVQQIRKREVFWVLSKSQIEHIVQDIEVRPVPLAPSYLKGIASWQGIVLPVLNLERFFGFKPQREMEVKRRVVVKTVGDGERRAVNRVLIDSIYEILIRPLVGACIPVRMADEQTVPRGLKGAFEWDNDKLLLVPEVSMIVSGCISR